LKNIVRACLALTLLLAPLSCGVEQDGQRTSSASVSQLDDSIWSWWVHPLSINAEEGSWIGGLSSEGDIKITRINSDLTSDVVTLDRIQVDDHNGPAIAYDPAASYLVVFYAEHNQEEVVHYRTIDRDTLAKGPRRTLVFSDKVTYCQALVHGRKIVLLTRVGFTSWRYRISEDFGATWTQERTLVTSGNGQVYCLTKSDAANPASYHLAFVGHPKYSGFRDVTHAMIRLDSGRITLADNTAIGSLYEPSGPRLDPHALDLAIAPEPGWAVRLLDVGWLGGVPAISYALWKKGSIFIPVRYQVKIHRDGHWYDASWQLHAGRIFGHHLKAHYHGGAVFTRGQGIVTSREEAGEWFLEKWAWDPAAETLSLVQEIYASSDPIVRPYVPDNEGRVAVIAHTLLKYSGYQNFMANTKVVFR
jgi:hypothetical protein